MCVHVWVFHFAYILTLQQKFQVGQTQQQQQQLLLLCCCSRVTSVLLLSSPSPDGNWTAFLPPHVLFLTLTCVGFCRRHRLIILHNIIRRFFPSSPPHRCSLPEPSKKSSTYSKTFQKLDKMSHLPVAVCVCATCVYWLISTRIKWLTGDISIEIHNDNLSRVWLQALSIHRANELDLTHRLSLKWARPCLSQMSVKNDVVAGRKF